MAIVRKTITLTESQEAWIRTQIESGHYTDESEFIRDLIRREQARCSQIEVIRSALIEGEMSGESETFDVSDFKQRMLDEHG